MLGSPHLPLINAAFADVAIAQIHLNSLMLDRNLLSLASHVEAALAAKKSVVALESTVIAHGLPRPQNLETAQRLEQIVREEGVTPATIAVSDGKLCVGLDEHQIEFLAHSVDIKKLSTAGSAAFIAGRCLTSRQISRNSRARR